MIVLVTLTVGLVFWVTAWAFGFKAFDGFLIAALFTVMAAAVRIATPASAAPDAPRHAGAGRAVAPPGSGAVPALLSALLRSRVTAQ